MRSPFILFALALASGCGLVFDLDPRPVDGGADAQTSGCVPGTTEDRACGNCGTERFTCSPDGVFVGEGCLGEGVCAPGEVMPACPMCSAEMMTCSAECRWPTDIRCCTPGETVQTSEGCAPGSVRDRTCTPACTFDDSDCVPVADDPFVVVPFDEPPTPARLTLSFSTFVALGDIYFLFDESASLTDDIAEVRSAVASILDARSCDSTGTACRTTDDCGAGTVCSRLLGECIESPRASGCIAELWSGAGGYGSDTRNLLSLQPDASMTATALGRLGLTAGIEEMYEAALAIARPSAVPTVTGCTGPGGGSVGCPAYRPEARRLLLMFSDEGNSVIPPTADTAGRALIEAGITLIMFNIDGFAFARPDMEALARAAGSYRPDGTPLVYDVPTGSVITNLELALDEALTSRAQEVTIRVTDDPSDAVDATIFIDHFETNTTSSGCTAGPTSDADGDGHHDTFDAVIPGDQVCFDLVAATNATVAETDVVQLYPVIVEVLGDGAALDRVVVTFVVPPAG